MTLLCSRCRKAWFAKDLDTAGVCPECRGKLTDASTPYRQNIDDPFPSTPFVDSGFTPPSFEPAGGSFGGGGASGDVPAASPCPDPSPSIDSGSSGGFDSGSGSDGGGGCDGGGGGGD